MKNALELTRMNLCLLDQEGLSISGGQINAAAVLTVATMGSGLGLYLAICGLAYYGGYAAHVVYDKVSN